MALLIPANKILSALMVALLSITASAQSVSVNKLFSPDNKTIVWFNLNNSGQLFYRMDFDGQRVTNWSMLGLDIDGKALVKGVSVRSVSKSNHAEVFDWPLGEDAHIENNYHQVILHCQSDNTAFDLVARAFDGSLAFRIILYGPHGRIRLVNELTEFNMANDYHLYQYHEESVFRKIAIDSLQGICDIPATLVSKNKLYVSIGEAENRSYSKCVLVKGNVPSILKLSFYVDTSYSNKIPTVHKDTLVTFEDSVQTPWRTISCANTAIGLHRFSQLSLKLVSPKNTLTPAGIVPGKVFRVPVSTQGGMDGIDLAQKMNFQYILYDSGWYGAEFRTISDPAQPIPGLDLKKVIDYGKSKGIGVILYVNYVGLRAKIDAILPLYKHWGVSGLKFGFVDGGTQRGISWLDTVMQKVNDYGFVLNVHDHYKPTGLSRRYPFYLSQEGVRGDENSPDAFHTMVLPYTRYLAGAADFTFCYPNHKNSFSKNLKVSKGQQLALTVVYFDPLQSIFWYGKSQDYDTNDRDIEFFKYVPTVWDESHFLAGEIGENVSVARRKGDVWYMGSATGFQDWKTQIPLAFLKKKQVYIATFYMDNGRNGIDLKTIKLTSKSILHLELKAKGGQAIILRPQMQLGI